MSKPYLRDDLLEVRESKLHGRGLFAAKSITKGTELGLCRARATKGEGAHVLWIDDHGNEKYQVLCDLKYINHGKQPNVAYYDDLTVVALKKIKAGEELLHDYGDEWE
ncbi:SET domain-containing protein [Alcanivorax sp. DP30]|uniref:SET domain-containing protein n=1 Tax=Alcanivorax sp. DP30 TaxID=2606217 RepID=UPI001369D6F4|nr:SET domain-containing protein-lysine N-methyltransferase [Alcanivorax sp. DP30]MZR61873.1 SET domain-containing protein-lysine N-methyltransferase [Alcanivorax sp. DP30]